MEKQRHTTLEIKHGETEWLYVPDVEYADYPEGKRRLQLIMPYRRVWEKPESFPLVVYVPGAAWHRQEMYNSLPCYSHLAERGVVFAAVQTRESELAKYPAPLIDIKNAIRFLILISN